MSSTGKRNRAHASPSTSMIPVSPTNPPELPGSVRLPPLSEVLASFDDDDDENLYRPGPKLCVNPNSTVRGWQDLLDSNRPSCILQTSRTLYRIFSTWPDVTSLRFHIEEFVFSHLAGSAGCFVAAITQVCSAPSLFRTRRIRGGNRGSSGGRSRPLGIYTAWNADSFKQLRRNTEPMKITVNLVGHSMHAAIALHLISFPIHFEFTITGFGGAEWLNSLFSENWEAIINQLKIHSAYTRSFVLVLRREDVLLTEAYKRLVRDVADLGIHNLAVKVVDGIRSVVEDTSVLNVGDGSS